MIFVNVLIHAPYLLKLDVQHETHADYLLLTQDYYRNVIQHHAMDYINGNHC